MMFEMRWRGVRWWDCLGFALMVEDALIVTGVVMVLVMGLVMVLGGSNSERSCRKIILFVWDMEDDGEFDGDCKVMAVKNVLMADVFLSLVVVVLCWQVDS